MVNNLKVMNDMAEREVKLITDCNLLLTKDEQHIQYVLQVAVFRQLQNHIMSVPWIKLNKNKIKDI